MKYRKIWLFFGLVQISVILILTLTPNPPNIMNNISYIDKIGHFSGYAVLMLWYCQLYSKLRERFLISTAFILMGISLEFLQGLGGIRMYEVADMFANAAGVLIGTVLAYVGMDTLLLKFEKYTGINKQT